MKNIFVEELIKRFNFEYEQNVDRGIYAITQRVFAYNSNRIEKNELDEEQIKALFEEGTLEKGDICARAKDVEETIGHFNMFIKMLKTCRQPLTEKLIKEYHYALKAGVFEDMANGYNIGEYKNRINTIKGNNTTHPAKVGEEMCKLLNWYNSQNKINLYILAQFHAQYEKIHPFQDGNGRTGRMILFKECLKNGIVPFIIEDNNREEYEKALAATKKNNYDLLYNLFRQEQKIYEKVSRDLVYNNRDTKHNEKQNIEK